MTQQTASSPLPGEAAALRQREIQAEQRVVDVAYRELDRQLAAARKGLADTEARGASGTHQSRGERDAYAVHYSTLISALEGVEDRLVFGRMDMRADAPAEPGASLSAQAGALPAQAGASTQATEAGGTDGAGESAAFSDLNPITHGGRRHYVGRTGLQDERHREVVLDWRAPLARAFYQATASQPLGLVRRRHIDTRHRAVVGLEDEVIDIDSLHAAGVEAGEEATVARDGLQGEGALIAAMSAARDGRMGDIVATIQAEQDKIVTSDGTGVLVVQGGPGTGKTAVALHRVAYLFYAERQRLERSGVLLVGPSRTFLRYVEQVLPSLGETGVVATTIADLVPGVRARGRESSTVEEIKGRAIWATILQRAVRDLQRMPSQPRDIEVQGTHLTLLPQDVRDAMTRARRSGKPHNLAREPFVLWLLERLTDQYAAATHQDASDEETRAWIREDIRTARDARREINLCWMPTSPLGLLEKLFSRPAMLERLAPELTQEERELLFRMPGSELTPADIPLVDELMELLGPSDDAQARQARLEAKRREALVAYAAQAIESQGLGDGMVSAEMLADRMEDAGPSLTLAERARADRTWTYGHIVVDEAQELGDMAWRALARRCPVRSMTVVGDLAQYSGPTPPDSWAQALASVGTHVSAGKRKRQQAATTPLREEVLSVCYRTPATIMQAADDVVTSMGHPPVYPVRSVRDLPDCLAVTDLSDSCGADAHAGDEAERDELWARMLREIVRRECSALDEQVGSNGGRLAVITPQDQALNIAAILGEDEQLAAAMDAPGGDVLRARLAVMGPVMSKGLEFDVVILVEPTAIGQVSPGDLYVAMTRPTRRLHVVSRTSIPAGLTGSQPA